MSTCCCRREKPIRLVRTILGVVALAAPMAAQANWPLALQMFQHSNINRAGWCYGYTIVWEGSHFSTSTPTTLENETWTSDDTATWLDSNVYSQSLVLPGWVRLDSGATRVLIDSTTIDELANKDQRIQWGPPPALQPPDVAWRRYNNWLVNNRGKLVRDQANLEERMVNLRGGYHQPLTVVLFDQQNRNVRPIVHNVLGYISPDSRLPVMDPNDGQSSVRSATFNNWQLVYSIWNGGQLVRQVWNNVFFTREYANRAGPGDLDPPPNECEGELLWENENYPDSMWFGNDMPLISFDPDGLSLNCPEY